MRRRSKEIGVPQHSVGSDWVVPMNMRACSRGTVPKRNNEKHLKSSNGSARPPRLRSCANECAPKAFARFRGACGHRPAVRLGLTRREAEILTLVSRGMRNSAIAKRLFLSTRTVDRHVSAILSKLGVQSRGEAVALANKE